MAYPWEPTLQQVAIWVPWLTVDLNTPGSQTPSMTFTPTTEPSNVHAGEHITQAAIFVAAAARDIPLSLYPLAAAITALRAAIALALAYPRDDQDIKDYIAALQKQYGIDWKSFLVAVEDEGGDDPATASPVMYAPEPVRHGDWYL